MLEQSMKGNLELSSVFYACVLLGGVFLSSVSQVLLKKAAQKEHDSWIREYLNLPVILAYALFFICTLLSVIAYRGIPLSLGPILETTGYFYITFFGIRIFHERLSRKKIMALALIIFGIVVYALSA